MEMGGRPRSNPECKNSQWARDRRALQNAMDPGSEEVILWDEAGRVYEGLSSNFSVLYHPSGSSSSPVLCSAPSEAVLSGTVQQIVEGEVCPSLGISVERTFPSLDVKIGKEGSRMGPAPWDAAFITSTTRVVMPIRRIRLNQGQQEILLPPIPEILRRIQVKTADRLRERATEILDRDEERRN